MWQFVGGWADEDRAPPWQLQLLGTVMRLSAHLPGYGTAAAVLEEDAEIVDWFLTVFDLMEQKAVQPQGSGE